MGQHRILPQSDWLAETTPDLVVFQPLTANIAGFEVQHVLEKAREQGQVARSRELSTSLVLLAGGLGLLALGSLL